MKGKDVIRAISLSVRVAGPRAGGLPSLLVVRQSPQVLPGQAAGAGPTGGIQQKGEPAPAGPAADQARI